MVIEIFERFFDEEILLHTQEQITKYFLQNKWPDISVSLNELKVFWTILIVSGYNTLPSKSLYWSHDPDVHNKAISNAMR